MEYVILGFLMIRGLSQYDILKALKKEVSPFYSASLGSIQSTLKKLIKLGCITCEKDTQTKRGKSIYYINDIGRDYFVSWMLSDISEKKIEAQISTKVFFLGLLEKYQRIVVIEKFIDFIQPLLQKYKKVQIESSQIKTDEKYADIAHFQLKTLDLGISEYENLLTWCEKLLSEMKIKE